MELEEVVSAEIKRNENKTASKKPPINISNVVVSGSPHEAEIFLVENGFIWRMWHNSQKRWYKERLPFLEKLSAKTKIGVVDKNIFWIGDNGAIYHAYPERRNSASYLSKNYPSNYSILTITPKNVAHPEASLVAVKDRSENVHVVWVGNDGKIWKKSQNGNPGSWHEPQLISHHIIKSPINLVATVRQIDNLDIFWIEESAVWHIAIKKPQKEFFSEKKSSDIFLQKLADTVADSDTCLIASVNNKFLGDDIIHLFWIDQQGSINYLSDSNKLLYIGYIQEPKQTWSFKKIAKESAHPNSNLVVDTRNNSTEVFWVAKNGVLKHARQLEKTNPSKVDLSKMNDYKLISPKKPFEPILLNANKYDIEWELEQTDSLTEDHSTAILPKTLCGPIFYNDKPHFFAFNSTGGMFSTQETMAQWDEIEPQSISIPKEHESLSEGFAAHRWKQHQQAITAFDEVLQLNPRSLVAYFWRGIVKNELGDYQDAISDYDRALELDPEEADVHFNRGLTLSKLNQHATAISNYNETIRLDSAYSPAYYYRGYAHYKMGEYAAARNDFMHALTIEFKDFCILNGTVYCRLKKIPEFNFQQIPAQLITGKINYYLGKLYEGGLGVEQDTAQAEKYYQQAYSIFETSHLNLDHYYYLGLLNQTGRGLNKNLIEAEKYYKWVLKYKTLSFDLRKKTKTRLRQIAKTLGKIEYPQLFKSSKFLVNTSSPQQTIENKQEVVTGESSKSNAPLEPELNKPIANYPEPQQENLPDNNHGHDENLKAMLKNLTAEIQIINQLHEQQKILLEKINQQELQLKQQSENLNNLQQQQAVFNENSQQTRIELETVKNEMATKLEVLRTDLDKLNQEFIQFRDRVEQQMDKLIPEDMTNLINTDHNLLEEQKKQLSVLYDETTTQIDKLKAQEKATQALNHDQENVKKSLEELRQNIAELTVQKNILWQERELKVKKQRILQEFDKDIRFKVFYETLMSKLSSLLVSFQAGDGEQVDRGGGSVSESADIIGTISDFVSIAPIVGPTVEGIIKLLVNKTLTYIDGERQKHTADRFLKIARRSEYNKTIEITSMRLVRWYVPQLQIISKEAETNQKISQAWYANVNKKEKIKILSKIVIKIGKQKILLDFDTAPAEAMAKFAFSLIIDGLGDLQIKENENDEEPSPLWQQFIDSVTLQKSPDAPSYKKQSKPKKALHFFSSKISKTCEKLSENFKLFAVKTTDGQSINLEAIFTKSGIVTLKGELYGGNGTDPSHFGFCLGDERAVEARELKRERSIKKTTITGAMKDKELLAQNKLYALVLYWADLFGEKENNKLPIPTSFIEPTPKPLLFKNKMDDLLIEHKITFKDLLQQFDYRIEEKGYEIKLRIILNKNMLKLDIPVALGILRRGLLETKISVDIMIWNHSLVIKTNSYEQANAMHRFLLGVGFTDMEQQQNQITPQKIV